MTQPIICIPRVDNSIDKKMIYNTFHKHNLGTIKKIDLIKTNKTQRAFIHYIYWNNNENTLKVKNWLETGKDFKIIYNAPWYWKCSAFKSTYN